MKKNQKRKLFIILYCLIISIITLLLNSKNSPLYPFNGWDDFNSFYTVGSNWYKGLIPYRDLVDQKGPLLYLIYLIAYLITPNKFIGIFILEILFLTITLYISNKIIKLFIKNKSNLIILPLYGTLLTTSISFVEGGSAEEFNLLFTTITIYYILKYLKNSNLTNITNKDIIINALMCGLSIMIKYNTIGLWFIMMAIICLNLFKQKKYKEAISKGILFIFIMLLPFILFSIYFYLNNALYDFLNIYFYINIFKYSTNTNILLKIFNSIYYFTTSLFKNIPTLILIFIIVYYHLLNLFIKFKKITITKKKITFLTISLFTIIILNFSQEYRPYNVVAIYFYILLLLTYLFYNLPKLKILKITSIIIIPILLLINIDYKYLFTPKEDTVQYHFANIINKYNNPTILQYRTLDEGFYTTTNTTPITKYFEQLNISYEQNPDNFNTQDNIIMNKSVDFVIFRKYDLNTTKKYTKKEIYYQTKFNNMTITPYLYENYELIETYYPKNGYYDTCIYYLYKIKDL